MTTTLLSRAYRFVAEAFPPPKKAGASGGPSTAPVAKPPVPAKSGDRPAVVDAQGVEDANGAGALAAMQQAEHQKLQLQAQQQKKALAADERERKHVKKLRAAADEEVAAALEDKYNDADDEVIFWPELLTFAQHTANTKSTSAQVPTSDTKTEDRVPGKKTAAKKKT